MSEENKLAETTEVTPASEPAKPEVKPEAKPETQEENPEVKAKQEQLANLNKAIKEANETLKGLRQQAKKPQEEELPQIDFNDPSSKAWDKHIKEVASPAREELEKAKEERRLFVLRQFLTDRPALAKDPEKVKAMMQTYEKIKSSTELTNEGIEMDLEKAYAAEHSQELISLARQERIENAQKDALFSDIAVTKGSTTYSNEKPTKRGYSEEEKAILAKWGLTPAEHAALIEEQSKKEVG